MPDAAGRRRAHPRASGSGASSPTCSPGRACPRCWSYPFVGADRYAALGLDVDAEVARTVRLANPLSDEQPLMRTRLLATMVDALRRNVARGTRDVGALRARPRRRARRAAGLGTHRGRRHPPVRRDARRHPCRRAAAAAPRRRCCSPVTRERAGWWGAGRPADVADVVEVARAVGESLGVALEVAADAVAALPPRPLRPRRRWPTAPSSATPASCTPRWCGARAAGPHRGRRARPRRADGGVGGHRAGEHAEHLPDGAERRRRRRRRVGSGGCRAALPARRRRESSSRR